MKKHQYMTSILQPLAVGSFTNWLRLLWENGGVGARYVPKALYVSIMSFLFIPLRALEHIRFGAAIESIEITESPIFILGHWRTGTTLLHNLLSQDENLGYVSTLQTIAPESFLVSERLLRFVLTRILPQKRPQDNVQLSLDLPQEEEIALANVCPYSYYHGWYFPNRMRDYFRKAVLFEGASEEFKAEWKQVYTRVLKKATYVMNGKRLVLKNPANTARIRMLLEMFPDAKFIYIYRNPYVLFPSTQKLYRKFLEIGRFQDINDDEVDENILLFFRELMDRYLEERGLIPPGNLVEIRFEVFEESPLDELERIYAELCLPGFDAAATRFRSYLASQAGYKKNVYELDDETIKRVSEEWRSAIEEWDYNVPEDMAGS